MADQIRRIVTLLSAIPRHPDRKSIEQLMRELRDFGFAVNNRRQIERDMVTLERLGFPLVHDDRRPTGWSWALEAPAIHIPYLPAPPAYVVARQQQPWGKLSRPNR